MFKIVLVLMLIGTFVQTAYAGELDQQSKQAGKDIGNVVRGKVGTKDGVKSHLVEPLTKQNVQLQTIDNSKAAETAPFCGQGEVRDKKIAIRVTLSTSSVTIETDTNDDGVLDSTRSFTVSRICIDGYATGTPPSLSYYRWTVVNGIAGSVSSGQLNGCVETTVQPATYVGGAVAKLFSETTGRTIVDSSLLGSVATYYSGKMEDCQGNTQKPEETKYYSNPYTINDAATAKSVACTPNSTDPSCQAYTGIKKGNQNVAGTTSGSGNAACTIVRTVIDQKGPQNGKICEASTLYFPTGYSEQAQICYKTAGDRWDYNSKLRVRCDPYGKSLTLEGWAYWEGAPCGTKGNHPPDDQIKHTLPFGGSSTSQIIGRFSTNRRMDGDNTAANDIGDVRCVSDVTPFNVRLSHSCPANNETCTYMITVENVPACNSFSISITPPVSDTIDDGCDYYEKKGCKMTDEWWYDAQNNKVQTMANGASTNNFLSATCKNFPTVGSVCREWWKKDRLYLCESDNKKYEPDLERASVVKSTADNMNSDSVKYQKTAYNTAETKDCIVEIIYPEIAFLTKPQCEIAGGKVICPLDYSFNETINKCEKLPECPLETTYNPQRDRCERAISYSCPLNYTFSSVNHKCEATPLCESGVYTPTRDVCESTPVPSCLSGFAYNATNQKCEKEPTCETGTYNPTSKKCESVSTIVCTSGYTYNSTTQMCEKMPDCLSNSTYNATTDKCEANAVMSCIANTIWNPTTQRCEATPTCYFGGEYNSINNRCEIQATSQYKCSINSLLYATLSACQAACTGGTCLEELICISGYTLSNGVCAANATCPTGTNLNGATDKCETNPLYTCNLGGFTYNASSGKCERSPICASNGVLNTTLDLCELPRQITCQSGIYNPSIDKCEATPTCSSGGSFNSTSGKCEDQAILCPLSSGMTYNQTTQMCQKPPACPSGGSLNPTTDKCEANPNPCPPGYTYDPIANNCSVTPICTGGSLNPFREMCELLPKCVKVEYKTAECKYQNPQTKSGLYCAIDEIPIQAGETSRRIDRDCAGIKQCEIACIVQIPDSSKKSGYRYEKRACSDNGNNTYTCQNGGYQIQKNCDCIIETFDPDELKEEECEISCLVKSPRAVPQGNVKNDHEMRRCDKTIVNNEPVYTCPLGANDTKVKDCDCPDAFGLTVGVLSALEQAINDRECVE